MAFLDKEKMWLGYNELALSSGNDGTPVGRHVPSNQVETRSSKSLGNPNRNCFASGRLLLAGYGEGRVYVIASIVVLLVGLLLLRKWPSA
jgi:hypothetical protein